MADPVLVEVGPRLMVRMAALPWDAAVGLQSPLLAAAVDRLIELEAAAHVAADEAAGELERLIGTLPDGDERLALIALRRAFRRRAAVPVSDLPAFLPPGGLLQDGLLQDRCEHGCERLGELAAARDEARRLVDDAMTRERDHLLRLAASPGFQRAVAVSQPRLVAQLRSHLQRFAPSSIGRLAPVPSKARHLRFESTIVNLVLRGVGRPSPSAAWSGVFVVEVDATRGVGSLTAPDESFEWSVQPAPDAERVVVQVDLGVLVDAFAATAGRDLAVAHRDCWAWLSDAVDALPEPVRHSWEAAAGRLRRLCADVGETLAATTADEWVARHREVAEIVDGLRAEAGLDPVGSRTVLRLDWRLPLRGRVAPSVRAAAEASIEAWIRAQSAWGFGVLWAEATADALVPVRDRGDMRSSTGEHIDTERDAALGDADRAGLPTAVSLLARVGDAGHVSRAVELVRRFEQTVEATPGAWAARSVGWPGLGSSADASAHRMGPWGSALLIPAASGFSPRSVRGEPAIFQARLVATVPEVVEDARHALSTTGRAARSGRFTRYANPGAALGASMAPVLGTGPNSLRRVGREQVAVVEAGELVIPVIDNAARPAFSEPAEAAVYRAASTWGWELVASGLPFFPGEVRNGGHLPALCSADDVVVHPERWLLTQAELGACAAGGTVLDRFIAWRRLVGRRSLPEVLLVRLSASPNTAERLVLADSVLSAEAFWREVPAIVGVAVAVAGPTPDALLPGPDGGAHAGEVAVTFIDHGFAPPDEAGGGDATGTVGDSPTQGRRTTRGT